MIRAKDIEGLKNISWKLDIFPPYERELKYFIDYGDKIFKLSLSNVLSIVQVKSNMKNKLNRLNR